MNARVLIIATAAALALSACSGSSSGRQPGNGSVSTAPQTLTIRVIHARQPRIIVMGQPHLRLTPDGVLKIARANREPHLLRIQTVAALPSKYRINPFLATNVGLSDLLRGPVWIVVGRVRSRNECVDTAPPPAPKCRQFIVGRGYLVISDQDGRVLQSGGLSR